MPAGNEAGTTGFIACILTGDDCTEKCATGLVADGKGEYGRSEAIVSADNRGEGHATS
jgi:hypothetical protein